MNATSLLDLPLEVQPLIKYEFDTWQKIMPDAKTSDEARKSFEDMTVYSLRMHFLGRDDKLNTNTRAWCSWVKENLVEEPERIKTDSHGVACEVFNTLWELYKASPNVSLPQDAPKKQSMFSKIFKK